MTWTRNGDLAWATMYWDLKSFSSAPLLRVWVSLTLDCLNVLNGSGSVVPDNCICCLDECPPDMISPTDLGAAFNNGKWL